MLASPPSWPPTWPPKFPLRTVVMTVSARNIGVILSAITKAIPVQTM